MPSALPTARSGMNWMVYLHKHKISQVDLPGSKITCCLTMNLL